MMVPSAPTLSGLRVLWEAFPRSALAYVFGLAFLASYSFWLGGFSDHSLLLQSFAADWRYDGFSVDAGTHLVYGFDAPLAVVLLAILGMIMPLPFAAVLLSSLLWGGVCALIVRLKKHLPVRVGVVYHFLPWLLLVGVALEPFFLRQAAWSPVAALKVFLTLTVLLLLRERRLTLWTGLVMSLLVLSWFEGILFAGIVGLFLFRRHGWADGFLYALGLLIPLVGWGMYAQEHFGFIVPVGVYTDVWLYRQTDVSVTLLRLVNLMGGIFGANFSEGLLNMITGAFGIVLWQIGVLRWGLRTPVVAVSLWSVVLYAAYFLFVRTQIGAESLVVPRLLAFVMMFGGVLTVLEGAVHRGISFRVLRVSLFGIWFLMFIATAWHAKAWITYYEGLRANIGTYIGVHNTKPSATVLAREVGSIGRQSGLHMLDWDGRTDYRVAAALRTRAGLQVVRIIEGLKPTWVVLRDRDVSNMLASGYNIQRKYDFMQQFEMMEDAPHFLRDNPVYVVFRRR